MADRRLVKFIKEARARGYDDYQLKEPLLRKGWTLQDVEEAFVSLKPRPKFKNKITLFIDSDVLNAITKRANKNLFTVSEQIEDILRRSVLSSKNNKKMGSEKLDDLLVGIFSRRKRKN